MFHFRLRFAFSSRSVLPEKTFATRRTVVFMSLQNIELFQIQPGKDLSKCKQVSARLRSPARQDLLNLLPGRQDLQKNIQRKVLLYAITRVQRPSESPAALAEDYVPSEA
jgi:hypothetical protein